MGRNLKDISRGIVAEHKFNRNWSAVAAVLSCFVIVATFCTLALPAITLSGADPACGLEAHTHSEECYEAVEGSDEPKLACGKEEHVHSEACYEKADADDPQDAEQKTAAVDGAKTPKKAKHVNRALTANDANEADGVDIDLTGMITNVTLKRSQDGNYWEDVSDGKINLNDMLRFRIDYTIPKNTLNSSNRTVSYKLPQGLIVSGTMEGEVNDSTGKRLGTYKVSEDKITIVFDENPANDNKSGEIKGFVTFQGKVDESKVDAKGDETIPFSDKVSFTLHVQDKKIKTDDLKVQKTATKVDPSTGTIEYKIEVTSQNGTSSKVTLNDVMQNVKLDGSIAVEGISNPAVTYTDSGFNLTLPQMSANGQYVITYTAKLPNEMINGTVQANNKVSVDSTRSDGAKLHDEQEVRTDIKHELLNKEGKLENGKMHWTITVNAAKMDISGWTLSDKLNDIPFTGAVNISPAVNGQSQITLPYTFPQGSNQEYKITYETEPDKKLGLQHAINTAILTPNNGKQPITKDSWGWISNESFNPLNKVADISDASDIIPDEEGNITLPWTLTVDSTEGSIPAGWKLYDELENGQWFTKNQLDDFINAFGRLNYSLKAWTLKPNGEKGDEVTKLQSGEKYKAIELTFTDVLAKGHKYEVKYTSTAPVGSGGRKTFNNRATLNDQFEHKTNIHYEKGGQPTVKKYDATSSSNEDNTKHNFDSNSKPSWFIDVTIPNGYSGGKLYVDEILPDGVSMNSLFVENDSWVKVTEGDTEDDFHYKKDSKYNIVHISIPESQTSSNSGSSKTIRFKIAVNIEADKAGWTKQNDGNEIASFKNSVQLLDKDKNKIDDDDQTQEFSRKAEGPNIAKSAGTVNNGKIPYTLVINPEGKDLVQNSDTLNLKDELTYKPWNGVWWSATLVPGSVHVYKKNPDGSQGDELDSASFTQVYTELQDASDPYNPPTFTRSLKMTLPDSEALIVCYEYLIHGTIGKWPTFSNTATLTGIGGDGNKSENKTQIQIQESMAGADAESSGKANLTLHKVDSDNTGLGLQGAKFELYKYDSDKGAYVKVSSLDDNATTLDINTDKDGYFSLKGLDYNTAYYLKEIDQPSGYELDSIPYYFCVSNTDKTKYPDCKPNDFAGETRYAGDILQRTNKQLATYELPKTGGSGTMWYYAGGALLVTAAGIALCVRKRRLRGGGAT